jgi:2-phosphosulfolactate phosphatase
VGFEALVPEVPDVVVVVDVVRAFTTACILFARGAAEIVCVRDQTEAREFGHGVTIVGELEAGDLPPDVILNSPSAIAKLDAVPRRVVMFSLNGTRVLHQLPSAGVVLAASAANARATAEWITAHAPGNRIHLIATDPDGPEDLACALFLVGLLQNTPIDQVATERELATARQAHWNRWGRIVTREQWAAAAKDFEICSRLDTYPVVILADVSGRHPVLRATRAAACGAV